MPTINLLLPNSEKQHTENILETARISDLIKTWVETYNLSGSSENYELYFITANDASKVHLGREKFVSECKIRPYMTLQLRQASQHSVLNHDLDKTTLFSVSELPTVQKHVNLHRQSYPTRLKCYLEISKGKRIHVDPADGVTINRSLVASHLSRNDRIRQWIRGLSSRDSDLRFISRNSHCHIYLDSYYNRWLIDVGHRAIYIEGRCYNPGDQLELAAGMTVLRLGRAGLSITVHLSDI